jgi:hypothetical protein
MVAIAAAGCGQDPLSAAPTATETVTPVAGGVVALRDGSARLDVPPGAVTATTSITLVKTARNAPPGITARSPVFELEPAGLVFALPVHITFAFKDAVHPSVYWSNAAGGFDAIDGRVSGSHITADVTHFSSGFVGELVNGLPSGLGDDGGPGTIVAPSDDGGAPSSDARVSFDANGPSLCLAGTSCQPRDSCSESGPGWCTKCACGADGHLACNNCDRPWAGAGPEPPTDCGAGPTCSPGPPGEGCAMGGTGDGCVSGCQCSQSGYFACTVKCSGPPANCSNLGTWVNRAPSVTPPSWPFTRNNPALSFDVATLKTVMYGGYGGPSAIGLTDTWEWDGRTGVWTERRGSVASGFDAASATYDSARKRLVLFSNGTAQLWEWNGPVATWEQTLPATSSAPWPASGGGDYAAYDPARQRVVLFQTSYGVAPATWEWSPADGTWSDRTTSPSPAGIEWLVWDPASKGCVAFGGQTLDEVWVWDGQAGTWTQRSKGGAWPEPRSGAAMTLDEGAGRPLLFGGQAPGGPVDPTKGPPAPPTYYNQLWQWEGESAQWRMVDDGKSTSTPAGRTGHAMAYDSDRSRVVMFGGSGPSMSLSSSTSDLWEWSRSVSPVPGCP